MQKEKRSNLAIYTLAGSILLSSVIVSMNQANGAPTDKQITNLKSCVNDNFRSIDFAMGDLSRGGRGFISIRNC